MHWPVLALVVLPFVAAAATLPVASVLGRRTCWWAIATALVSLALTVSLFPTVLAGQPIYLQLNWVPALGVDLSFYIDGLSLLFALLITGIGTLVLIYARSYIDASQKQARFYGSMLFFMGSMIGLVLAGNLIVLFVFWELTSISSYLLIGYWDRLERSRYAATQALLITAGGGLAMLAGFVLLYVITGTFDIAALLGMREIIVSSPLYLPALLLILVGAFTKSAQFPFHFWLPSAMVAPTPVSTYLHSATMVKAGLFLLARLLPALGGTSEWILLVVSAGMVTMVVGGYIALRQTDLKALLAYSTVSQLGLITALYGLSTPVAVAAATFHLFNHAAFKGAMFMVAGYVEHEMGTRDLRQLGGLARKLPMGMAISGLAALALAGIPPLNGFLSKEMFFRAVVDAPGPDTMPWLLPLIAIVGSVFTFLYSIRFWHGTFFGVASHPQREAHGATWGFVAPPAILVAICVAVGLYALPAEKLILNPAVSSVLAQQVDLHIELWHGFDEALLMSGVVVAAGLAAYSQYPRIVGWQARWDFPITASYVYEVIYRLLVYKTPSLYYRLQDGSLRHYLIVIGLTMVAVVGFALVPALGPLASLSFPEVAVYEYAIPVLMIMAALATAALGERLAAVLALGLVGVLVSFTFVLYSAPDLALTQLLIEIMSVVLLIFVFTRTLPMAKIRAHAWSRFVDIGVAASVGAMVAVLMLLVTSGPFYPSIRDYFVVNTYEMTGGKNVVNVILVDFRGYDTLGEITVLGIAAIGLFCLIRLRLGKESK